MQVAEIVLSYRTQVRPSDRPKITSSGDCYEIFHAHWNPNTIDLFEEFKILLLNRAHRVLGLYTVSSGGITGVAVDPKLVFAVALKAAASVLVLCHNHPSQSLTPSNADENLTEKLREGGRLLEIGILDHLIISSSGYYSFKDEGLL